jgi:hypothetical protein
MGLGLRVVLPPRICMSNKSGLSEQVIALLKGGGALKGGGEKFSPDLHTGTGNFSGPIALSPGRNGFQPDLTLGYSTGIGNGPFGLGCHLSIPGLVRDWRAIELVGGSSDYLQGGPGGNVDVRMTFAFTRRINISRARRIKRLGR